MANASNPITQRNGVFSEGAFTRPVSGAALTCSILVVGGSTAAYTTTLTALRLNLDVCLVQPHKVVGGQFTAQALPASDDGDLLQAKATLYTVDGEEFAISKAQRAFRDRQRELQPVGGQKVANPGGGWVSPLATTPVVAATAMNEALLPYLRDGRLTLIPFAEPVQVVMQTVNGRSRVQAVVCRDTQAGYTFTVSAKVTVEATDLGDLLEVGNIPSRVGQEARHETGEAILPEDARPQCQQSITFDVVVEHTARGKGVPIGKPDGFETEGWVGLKEFTSNFWTKAKPDQWQKWGFFSDFGIFRYRRLLRSQTNEKKVVPGDVAVLNWGTSSEPDRAFCCGNDYRPGRLVGVSREERQLHIQRARQRARAYVHYLQTHGAADLKPRGDLTWTNDGIALEPYIREARRGIALATVRHEDVAETFFPDQARARCFDDSVGIGQYHYMDLHGNDAKGHVSPRGKDVVALPFSLPLGSLVPRDTDGLVLSAKSLGTTHITNAAYRMHPMEWAIGEASGFLAVFAVWTGLDPRVLATEEQHIRKIQGFMARNGIPIFWFNDVSHDDADFEAIQVLAAAGIIRSENPKNLNFRPHAPVNRAVVATALVNVLKLPTKLPDPSTSGPTFKDVLPGKHWAYMPIETLYAHGMIAGVGHDRFAPDAPITREQLSFLVKRAMPEVYDKAFGRTPIDRQNLQRRELSRVLYEVLKGRLGI
ncbi:MULTISPECIES: FAD-dependent oxidoreductase [Cyanophyceae]|uniref:FAD-dependent oxidoreductase n=1 Tax=Leptolyngbya subtilissima DQ-A4 TaxID=2933933 RepID=A0ABV0K724_9CYAN|nr:FAD-dependent oxidoreductase [Nodosilinea sp. FACHB-141]MBD2112678.1 FAD-dependent oxidoreductase [Nodosilinea sp. FACHB-141]